MIHGIGCDVVNHNLTQSLGWSSDRNKLRRIFSTKELELLQDQDSNRFFSGRFAVKEAVLKCLGTGMKDGISLTEIQVLQTKSGQPFIEIEGEVYKIAHQMGIASWHVSISHTTNSSTAFVIAES